MKREYALAAALVGALVLPLFGCQKNTGEKLSEEEVQRQGHTFVSWLCLQFAIERKNHFSFFNINNLPAI